MQSDWGSKVRAESGRYSRVWKEMRCCKSNDICAHVACSPENFLGSVSWLPHLLGLRLIPQCNVGFAFVVGSVRVITQNSCWEKSGVLLCI